jgi:hypothetical protein
LEGTSKPMLKKSALINYENKQKIFAVFAIVEAIILEIKKKMPSIEKISFQSDNAGCYQNTMLFIMCFLLFLPYAHGIEKSRLFHTENQEEKSSLNAHFARSMQLITSY